MKPGTCRHFTGCQNDACKVGVSYDSFRPHVGIPCIQRMSNGVTCSSYEDPTPEEIKAYEDDVAETRRRMALIDPVVDQIRREHATKSWRGSVPCPVCSGNLHIEYRAYNGHTSGRCETEDCLSWIE